VVLCVVRPSTPRRRDELTCSKHPHRKIVMRMLVVAFVVALLAGCGQSGTSPSGSAAGTHQVVDSAGASVTVPDKVARVADCWPAHNEIVQMLGAGNKIVATDLTPALTPWLYTIDPALHQAQTVCTNTVNIEALARQHPDVLFGADPTPFAAKTTAVGIPTLQLIFQNFAGLKKVVTTTADVLGPSAQAQAKHYNSYLDNTLATVTATTSTIPVDQRPSVLHIFSLNPLVVDGPHSIIDAWITAAGGRDAAQVSGNLQPVTTEQILKWNPDVIIPGSDAGGGATTGAQTLAKLTTDPVWRQLSAVRNHHVYINPTGAFLWDRYGIEEALQLQWAAKTLHPKLFPNLNLIAQTKSFYSQFLHYQLTDNQAKRILAGQNPT
jgi:iron complex transport system substrate-binding protein